MTISILVQLPYLLNQSDKLYIAPNPFQVHEDYAKPLKLCTASDPGLYFTEALGKLFSKETFAKSSVSGRTSGAFKDRDPKEPLDNVRMDAILGKYKKK